MIFMFPQILAVDKVELGHRSPFVIFDLTHLALQFGGVRIRRTGDTFPRDGDISRRSIFSFDTEVTHRDGILFIFFGGTTV